jgi:ABC-type multidrug transport system ATPase subunit
MKTIYALSGPSGAGKTYRRLNDPRLKDKPSVDIADVYDQQPNTTPDEAFSHVLNQVLYLIDYHQAVVVEAYFTPGNTQREYLDYYAGERGVEVVYVDVWAPLEVCKTRILKDASRDNFKRSQARIKLVETCHPKFPAQSSWSWEPEAVAS